MQFPIRHQLTIIMCSLILLAMVSTLMISHSLVSEDYQRKMQDSLQATAGSLAYTIHQFMQNAYNVNQQIAEYPDLENLDADKQLQLLIETKRRYPFYQVLAIYNVNGDSIAKTSGAPANRAERWWFRKFIADRQPFISRSYYSISSDVPVTSIIQGLYANGELSGIFLADIEVRQLQQMVENYSSGGESYAYLLDGEGVVVAHPDRQQVAELYNYKTLKKTVLLRDANGKTLKDDKGNHFTEEVPFALTPSLQTLVARVTAGEAGVGEYTGINGEKYLCAYRTIALPGTTKPWSLIVVQEKKTVMAFMDYVTVKTTLVGMLVIVFSIFLSLWFSRRLTRPLQDMVQATNQIKEGDLAVRLAVQSANEYSILAINFNQMVDELRQHRKRLQSLVEARTSQLEAANQEMLALNEELTAMNETLEDTNQRLNDENSARRQTEEKLLFRERQYRAITGLLTQPHAAGMEDILETILHNAVAMLNAAAGYIGLFSEDGKKFYIHHSIGIDKVTIRTPQAGESGILRHVYSTGKMFYIADYRVYAYRVFDKLLDASTSSVITIPLIQAGKVSGVLTICWSEVTTPVKKEDLDSLRQFGDLASVALERDTAQKKISEIAFHDTLTGLPNRVSLNLYLKEEMERSHLGQASGIILFIDIDEFKEINDNFGHSFGDHVLVTVSRYLVAAVDKTAFVARIGGDEFVVVIPGGKTRGQAAGMADHLIDELCREYQVALEQVHLSASVGVVMYPGDSDMAEDLVKKADIAMYAAKKAGKACWRFYEPVLLQETNEKMVLTNGLRRGLERGEFLLNYQPQYDAAGKRLIGFEALLRWNSAEHGFMPPDRFIPLAEQTGLIIPIGEWVFKEACLFARRLADMGKAAIHVAVNISPRQLVADGFVATVRSCIEAAGISPGQIEIEITESIFIESVEDAIFKLSQLRELGVVLSLDDFGTGYSSLTYLKSLPVGVLKIDKSFIDEIVSDQAQLHVVGAMINLGHNLGLSLVAEGVETEKQLKILSEYRCDRIQGYVFSKPLAAEAAIRLVTDSASGD
ncbi:EAL domain-containing protein [Sporomusa acidovorans]|uniref:Phytochrome-like protein cph2 n=1 Tax=Sporomusa acidovorans (strain ATCC 49682 / DSM 3132 / Mol) TaxID=1123286 RepID=A0ABZ3JBJ4_SPOA4|nr:EAL domain-containing protein [Sporomusa acidovorans]OZC13257.1 phytochrome-like protein cph2 [Sporomusa acidovorans DSM 3132]SDD99100.1 diguanylate cyclase (GGDEF) domain-containing protein [Sporomusa acidovorans]